MSETDILLVELFNSNAQTLFEVFFGFVSATSAFLVASHLAGPHVSNSLSRVAVALYAITSLILIGNIQRQGLVMLGIREQMEAVTALQWHPAVYEAEWIFPFFVFGSPVVESFLFVASLWFWFYTRRTNGSAIRSGVEQLSK